MRPSSFIITFSLIFALNAQAQIKSQAWENGLIGQVNALRQEVARIKCQKSECAEGERRRSTFEKYDAYGKLVSSNNTLFDPDNPIHRLRSYPFGDKSPIIEKCRVVQDGTFSERETYIYNNLSMQSEWISYLPDGSIEQRNVFMFNYEGRLAEAVTYDPAHQVLTRTVYIYDDKGNEIEQATYDGNGSVTDILLFEYEFDQVGNWIKKKMMIKRRKGGQSYFEPVAVYYRTITYH